MIFLIILAVLGVGTTGIAIDNLDDDGEEVGELLVYGLDQETLRETVERRFMVNYGARACMRDDAIVLNPPSREGGDEASKQLQGGTVKFLCIQVVSEYVGRPHAVPGTRLLRFTPAIIMRALGATERLQAAAAGGAAGRRRDGTLRGAHAGGDAHDGPQAATPHHHGRFRRPFVCSIII